MSQVAPSIDEFIEQLSLDGVDLWVEGDRLRYRGRQDAITPELLSRLKARKPELLASLSGTNGVPLPLSEGQRGLWFLHEMHPASAAYNVGFAARLTGPLDDAALREAIEELVARHPLLRTVFERRDGDPVQRVVTGHRPEYRVDDVAGTNDRAVEDRVRDTWREPFDPAAAPPVRFRVFRRADESHFLAIAMHHIVCDAWSIGLLIRDLEALYDRRVSGRSFDEFSAASSAFAEFIRHEQSLLAGSDRERLEAYWRNTLADVPTTLDLPTDRPRPPRRAQNGASLSFSLDPELSTRLRELSRSTDSTLFVTLLAAFQTLLHHWSGQRRLLVGSPVSLRSNRELAGTVGYLVNPLPLRADFTSDPTFEDLTVAVRQGVNEALEHRAYPFARIREMLDLPRDPSRTPVFQTSFVFQQLGESLIAAAGTDAGGLRIEPWPQSQQEGQFDLVLEVVDSNGRLDGILKYDIELFDDRTMQRVQERFVALLAAVAAEPHRRVSTLPAVGREEHAEVVAGFNQTQTLYPQARFLHELIADQAARTPGARAVRFEADGTPLTYAELEERSNRVAHHLRALGVGPESLVGVYLERSVELVVGLVGILKSSGAYVPLEPDYPESRVAFMLADCAAPVVLTSRALTDRLPAGGDGADTAGSPPSLVFMDSDEPWWSTASPQPPSLPPGTNPDQAAAYMIYTSGTTGRPKGVVNRHASIVNRLRWMQQQYELGADDRVLQKTPMGFDVSVWEFFWPLMTGAELVVSRPGGHRDNAYLVDLIRRARITTLHFVPPMLRALLDEPGLEHLTDLRRVVCSGEALDWELQEWFFDCMPSSVELWNLYGPTEAAVDVTVWQCRPHQRVADRAMVPIGRPIANTRIYIVNEQWSPVGVGVPGELLIGGDQVARGYHGRPSLTAGRFIPDPFSDTPGQRLYRTGDLCRWLDGGVIEYLGRLDHQVKVRGVRVELGDVEAALGECETVQACVSSVHSGRLVAWIVGTTDGVLDHLRTRLPEAMVPSLLIPLDALPLSPNGKVDRNALPSPDWSTSAETVEHVAPRTREEAILAEIWSDVLEVDRIGVHDNFFALGGDSIQSARMVARARSRGLSLTVADLFDNQTVEQLAASLDGEVEPPSPVPESDTLPPIAPVVRSAVDADEPIPLSFAQRRLWFLDRLQGPTEVYNIPLVVRLAGVVDVDAMHTALRRLVARHESLRTTFVDRDGRPQQVIHEFAEVPLQVVHATDRDHARQIAAEHAALPFDLERGPLIRAVSISIDPEQHVLAIILHHIIGDGWSLGVLTRELSSLYESATGDDSEPQDRDGETTASTVDRGGDDRDAPVPSRIQYADYAAWLHEHMTHRSLRTQLDYWRGRLSGAPALLELPTDRPRPLQTTYRGNRVHLRIDAATADRVREMSGAANATLFMSLLTVFATQLHRWSGRNDIVIGSPVANRNLTGTEDIVGCFINNLALRCDLSGEPTFVELLERIRTSTFRDFANQDLPFEQLVDELQPVRDLSHSPLFQVMFVLQNQPFLDLHLPGIAAEFEPIELEVAKYDLTLTVVPADDGRLDCEFEYSTDLFDEATIRRTADRFSNLLSAVIRDPSQRLSRLPAVSPRERDLVVHGYNDTAADFPQDLLLHDGIAAQALRTPSAPAVRFEADGPSLTYLQLDRRANQLAHQLRSLGVGRESLVGIYLERSVELVVSLLGILKSGAAYVPLDPDYPRDRVRFMLADCGAPVVCTSRSLAKSIPLDDAESDVSRCEVLLVNPDEPWWSHQTDTPPDVTSVDPQHAAYMIYTSGTTGQPKGVINSHRAIVNRLLWMQQQYVLTTDDRVLQKTPMSFDVSVWEFFWPLMTGAELVLAKAGGHREGRYLVNLLREAQITTVHFVPSMLRAVLEESGLDRLTALRRIVCSGEALDWELQQRCFEALPETVELWNLYGPTEAAVDVTFWKCEAVRDVNGRHIVPIGQPVANTRIHILDETGEPAGVGVPGELCIGGVQVARGYHARPALTADRFVPDPFSKSPGRRMYRTGDLCRWLDGGTVEYLGRLDHQVKIRGVRVELGEIESVIAECDGVKACVVTLNDSRLVAYVVGASDGLLEQARRSLPEAMVPAIVVPLDEMPLTPAGKIDRRSLPAPDWKTSRDDVDFVAPRSDTEQILADTWSDLLGLDQVGVHANFFALGGDSIISTQIVARAARQGIRVSVAQLFRNQTVAELAAVARTADDVENADPDDAVVSHGPVPVTPIPAWFLEQSLADPHHFNQSVVVRIPQGLPTALLADALSRLQERHAALRLRLRDDNTQHLEVVETAPDVEVIELGTHDDVRAGQLHSSLDLVSGPIWRAVRLGTDRLLLIVHHLAVDAVSWQILVDDLATICDALQRKDTPSLPPPTASFRQWAHRQATRAAASEISDGLEYWVRHDRHFRLPQDCDVGGSVSIEVDRTLDAALTTQLVRDAPTAFNNRVNELLLAAVARVAARWADASNVRIDVESHGRDPDDTIDVSRTVGWFTALRPVRLSADPGRPTESLLQDVKQELRAVPGGDSGFGLLRYMHPDAAVRERMRHIPDAPILFNYLGNADRASTDSVMYPGGVWEILPDIIGPERAPGQHRRHPFEVTSIVRDGRLRIRITCDGGRFQRATVEHVADRLVMEIDKVIAACVPADAGGYSSVDFPLAGIDQRSLDAIALPPRQITDLYPLSPLQEGMLYHSLLEAPAGVYFLQHVYRLNGHVDSARLQQAFQNALDRHSAWRTSFHWQNVERPLQAVHRRLRLPWNEMDWTDVAADALQDRIEHHLHEDRSLGVDLSRPPLLRATLCRLSGDEWLLFWSQHHLLGDGWSWSRVLAGVFETYEALVQGHVGQLAPSPPYRGYIEWLAVQDHSAAQKWWQRTLAGRSGPIPLPWRRNTSKTRVDQRVADYSAVTRELSEQQTTRLAEFARDHRLTLNVLVQGAWALLLSRCSRATDVVFGATFAGRPAVLPNAESMVGLMMNTLPVRVNVPSGATVTSWLRTLLEEQGQRESFLFSSLAEIQACSPVASGEALFESVVVFESYPVDESLSDSSGSIRITDARFIEGTNYPITLVVVPGGNLEVTIKYDTACFDHSGAARMAGHLIHLLMTVASRPDARLGELSLIDDAHTQRILAAGRATRRRFPAVTGLHHPVEQAAQRTPHATAVRDLSRSLSYAELDRSATRLAAWLQQRGVGPEQRVGIALPRSVDQVVALLGVLKAGGAYVPLDTSLPEQRLAFLTQDADPILVLDKLPDTSDLPNPDELAAPATSPAQTAYVIYTSGSTGTPKGVAVEHRAIVNHMQWMLADLPIEPSDVVLQKTPLSFDASVWEVWGPLWAGATLVLPAPDTHRDPEQLLESVRSHAVSVLQLVPSQLRMLLDVEPSLASLTSVRRLCCGGEALSGTLVEAATRLTSADVVNLYGPTEAAIDALFHTCGPDDCRSSAAIGQPIANMRALILDDAAHLVPDGVVGELFLAGDGLARGYHGQPASTAKRFVPDPFTDHPGSRLYRTGDLVRRRDDGVIEFVGRADDQVKLRGHRIEPGEIDAALRELDQIVDAATVVCDSESGDPQLRSFYVATTDRAPAGEDHSQQLREHLRRRLPAYMIPSGFVPLKELPTTPGGKIDRKALKSLPPAAQEIDVSDAPPRTATEQIIAQIWSRHLGLTHVGIGDSFLDLGGHSLLATRIVSELRSVFAVELPLRWFFESPTIEQLAARLDELRASATDPPGAASPLPPITRTDTAGPQVLSFAQQRLWLLDMIEGDTGVWNMPAALRLRGRLDVDALRWSLNQIVQRHDVLRSHYELSGDDPVQIVEPATDNALPLPVVHVAEADVPALAAEHARHPFDLTTTPAVDAKLLRVGPDDHVLLSVIHHIAGDGWSTAIVVRELCELYRARVTNEPTRLPELPVQYGDYARWQREHQGGDALAGDVAWWKNTLAGAPGRLELPTDRPRPTVQTFAGASETFVIPGDVVDAVHALSRDRATTPFMTLLAAWSVLMSRLSGQQDLVIGTPVAGRDRQEMESLVGCFLNTLPLRIDLNGNPRFVDLLPRVRQVSLDAFAHQHVPFDQIVDAVQPERSLSWTPVFQVLFALQNQPSEPVDLPGLSVERLSTEAPAAKHDLSLYLEACADGLSGQLEYNTDLFDRSTITRLAEQFATLIRSAVSQPEEPVESLPILSDLERQQLLHDFNATDAVYPAGRPVHELIRDRVGEHPDREAVRVGDRQISYADLDVLSNQLAAWLTARRVGRGDLVGVCMPRSPDLVVALLGVMKSGAAYVPLDPIYPEHRRRFMVDDSNAALVLTVLPEGLSELSPTANGLTTFAVSWDDPAYVIYTSGSTGRPKGVRITHRNLSNFLHSMRREPGLSATDVMLAVTTVSFDIAALELFGPLLAGGRVVLAADGEAADGVRLAGLIESSGATVMQATPATWRLLIESGWTGDPDLRILCGGEALHGSLASELLDRGASLWNLYGPTETTIWSTLHQVTSVTDEDGDASVSIGRPIANTQIYILDRHRQPVPVGVIGELYIGGDGVGPGYLNRPELTAERFVPDPFAESATARLYRTGDLARLQPDGTCLYLGRTDNQIKLRGFRIELGEIEGVLAGHDEVAACAVVLRDDRLDAYVVPRVASVADESTARFDPAGAREYLGERLPDYMIPGTFTVLETLPQTPNGKTDRAALPEPNLDETVVRSAFLAPQTEIETQIAGVWRAVLGLQRVGLDDNFFDLGGDSLKLAQVRSRLEQSLGDSLSALDLFQHPTVRTLAGFVAGAHDDGGRPMSKPDGAPSGAGRGRRQRAALARQRSRKRRKTSNE